MLEKLIKKYKNNVYEMQLQKFKIFEAQDQETGHFDVKFEIEGRSLYAHKFDLSAASETLNAWLSARWTTNNDPIKIETYSFEIFYQLCCFLYSGGCTLITQNIFQIIDAAEFFGIQLLKNFCEDFLVESKIINEENIFKMSDFAEKYSLRNFAEYIDEEYLQNLYKIFTNVNFEKLEKLQVMKLCEIYNKSKYCSAPILDILYKWSKYQTDNQNYATDDQEEAIKKEFMEFLSYLNFDDFSSNYLKDFVAKYPFLFSVKELHNYFPINISKETEAFVEIACKISENELKKKVEILSNDAIENRVKNELSNFLDKIEFSNLTFNFVVEYILQQESILFSTKKLYKSLAQCKRTYEQEEQLFKIIYEIAEKEVLQKQEKHPVENFDFFAAIKTELAEFLPKIKFYLMDEKYVTETLLNNGIISLQHTLYNGNIRVQIVSGDISLFGTFQDKFGIVNAIRKNRPQIHAVKELEHCFAHLKFRFPEARSELKKSDGIQWYLCLTETGGLAAKHHTVIKENDYLIAEMKYNIEKGEFRFDKKRFTDIYAYRI